MNIIVTGANGFVGSNLCRFLLDKGETVHGMIVKGTPLSTLKRFCPDLKSLHLFFGDVTDINSLKTHFKDKDIIIHLAGIIKALDPAIYYKVNVQGTLNVCKAVQEVNPHIKRLVLTSSITGCSGGRDICMTEDMDSCALEGDRYGISKNMMEKAVDPYFKHSLICINSLN